MKRYNPLQTILLAFTLIFSTYIQSTAQTEISLNLMVTGAQGRFIEGLTSDNFRLYENGKEQIVKNLTIDNTSLRVGFMVDVSGSMAKNERNRKFSRVDWGRQSILDFIAGSDEKNEYFLTTFSETAQPFTNVQSKNEMIKTIKEDSNFVIPKNIQTGFYDAVALGIEQISKAKDGRKVLFILSDGQDNKSRLSFGNLLKLVRKSKVAIFLVAIYDPTTSSSSTPDFIVNSQINNKKLTDDSGGQVFYISSLEMAQAAAKIIANEMKSQYKINFAPKIDNKESKWRELRIKVVVPKDKRKTTGEILVTHPKGYFTIPEIPRPN
jgi:Ca-activated chloride channel family protein